MKRRNRLNWINVANVDAKQQEEKNFAKARKDKKNHTIRSIYIIPLYTHQMKNADYLINVISWWADSRLN